MGLPFSRILCCLMEVHLCNLLPTMALDTPVLYCPLQLHEEQKHFFVESHLDSKFR